MSIEIRLAAAYLVVGDDLPPRFGDAVEHFEIVVRTSRPAMQQQQGRFPFCFAHDSVVGLVTHERHIALSDFILHNVRIRCEISSNVPYRRRKYSHFLLILQMEIGNAPD